MTVQLRLMFIDPVLPVLYLFLHLISPSFWLHKKMGQVRLCCPETEQEEDQSEETGGEGREYIRRCNRLSNECWLEWAWQPIARS